LTPPRDLDRGQADKLACFLHADLTGTVRAITAIDGLLVAASDHTAFGQPIDIDGVTPVSSVTSFGYAGAWTDPDGRPSRAGTRCRIVVGLGCANHRSGRVRTTGQDVCERPVRRRAVVAEPDSKATVGG
jgi:hypothetical protein